MLNKYLFILLSLYAFDLLAVENVVMQSENSVSFFGYVLFMLEEMKNSKGVFLQRFEEFLPIMTAISAISTMFYAIVAMFQFAMFKKQLGLMQKSADATHRPKLRVRNFHVVFDIDSIRTSIECDSKFTLIDAFEMSICNVGDADTQDITITYATMLANNGTDVVSAYRAGKCMTEQLSLILHPGESYIHRIKTDKDIKMTDKTFYVIGLITYKDKSGLKRNTGFFRKHRDKASTSQISGYFEKVDYFSDYDYED